MPDGSYRGVVAKALTDYVFTRMANLPPLCRPPYDCLFNEGFSVSSSAGDILQNACPPDLGRYEIGDLYFAAEAAIRQTEWWLISPPSQSRPLQPLIPLPTGRRLGEVKPEKHKVEQ